MSDFCRIHGYYDCPLCRGEEIIWTIPVYTGSQKTGELKIHADGDVDVLGVVHLPAGELEEHFLEDLVLTGPGPVTVLDPVAIHPEDAKLLERSLGSTRLDGLLEDPRWEQARARGRAVHDAALELVDEGELTYDEAIQRVLEAM